MSQRYNMVSAIGAFLLWGGWAFWINQPAGLHQAMLSGITQGTASLLITLAIVKLIGFFFNRLRHPLRLWLPPLLTISITGSLLVCAHWLARTPHIVSTIALPITVAFIFCLFTAYRLERATTARTT